MAKAYSNQAKAASRPDAKAVVGCKHSVNTGKDGKKYDNYTGTLELEDGTKIRLKVSKSTDKALKEKGIGYWIEAAVWNNSGSRNR